MLRALLLVVSLAFVAACDEKKAEGPAPSRFASAKKQEQASRAATVFCEKQWPAAESGSRRYTEPPDRPIPNAPTGTPASTTKGTWKWVNIWATWCQPCVEEMGLLGRWRSSLEKDGVPMELELWSVDEEQDKLVAWLQKTNMPGRVRWLRSPEDMGPMLESLGADKASAIPVHALVDGAGNLRCLRVGSVHDEDYGAVKAMLTGA